MIRKKRIDAVENVTVSLMGNFHRKQLDLIAIANRYKGVKLVINQGDKADFTFATETDIASDITCSELISSLDNKSFFKRFCDKHNLPTLPWSENVSSIEGDVLFKPINSSGSVGIRSANVRVNDKIPPNYIAELKLNDFETYGMGFYAFNNKVKARSTWKRIKTFPRSGGPSTIAELSFKRKLDSLADSFLEQIASVNQLNGLFMIEFISHQDSFYFLECNPRPWGSIAFMELSNPGFWKKFCYDNFKVNILSSSPPFKFKYFVNPIFEPLMFFKSNCFYSGFSAGIYYSFFYIYKFISIESLKKLFNKIPK